MKEPPSLNFAKLQSTFSSARNQQHSAAILLPYHPYHQFPTTPTTIGTLEAMSRCCCCPNRPSHMGENPERWDLPEILPCRACITRNFSSPEFYHLNCNAETEDTICDYCATHDIE